MLLPDIFRKASGRHSRGKWGDCRDCPGLSHRKTNVPCPSHIPQQHSCSSGAKQSLPSPHRALDSRSPSLADCHPRLFHQPQTLESAGPFQLLWPPAAVRKVFAPPERPPRVQPWEEQLQVGRAWLTGLLHTHRNTLRTTHSNQDPPNPAALINTSHLGLPERLSRGTPR